MTEDQKECLLEINELLLSVAEVVEKYNLKDTFISSIAVGFIDNDSIEMENDEPMGRMNLLCATDVENEEELDDLLSCVVDIYRHQVKEDEKNESKNDPSTIDYWLNFGNQDDSIN